MIKNIEKPVIDSVVINYKIINKKLYCRNEKEKAVIQ